MEAEALALLLRQAYDRAGRNETACQIHLFGIQYATELKACGCPLRQIVQLSGISMGYLPELSKGVKLAGYVQLKPSADTAHSLPPADQHSNSGGKKE